MPVCVITIPKGCLRTGLASLLRRNTPFLRALDEETGSIFKTITFIAYHSKKYIYYYFVFVCMCQKQDIIYDWGIFPGLIYVMSQRNTTVVSKKYLKLFLMGMGHLTTLTCLGSVKRSMGT